MCAILNYGVLIVCTYINVFYIALILLLCMILFSDIIKEVIDQQSTLYDNVNVVANFFKFEQVRFKVNEIYTTVVPIQQPPSGSIRDLTQ